ncbi:hypothetical protein CC86DRAFT_449620 [Ophiobolus disseminans]|uniref:Tim44-like domain-containing protein n=1 Tax=Ophiobolus disseminans TaxID=1469910 RepID=A0A6A6ZGY7_9PLEO|nr:hypothetical protein CC86DRAFT_449620 [Ophiobolus disseminans]
MSSNLPLRTTRIPALQRQCLFQRRQPRAFSTTAPQALASTSPRLRGQQLGSSDKSTTKAAAKSQVGPAPRVHYEKALSDQGMLAEDIGLLQDTVIRARFRDLPAVWKGEFWSYVWKLVKSKGTALYSRSIYNRMLYRKGFKSYLPVDRYNNTQLKDTAKKLYEQIYSNFAKGELQPISRFCLPPLTSNFKTRIDARGTLKMDWKLVSFNSVSVVSHRTQPFGEDQPNTAYRQAVVRIESTQQLKLSGESSPSTSGVSERSSRKGLRWVPDEVQLKQDTKTGEKAADTSEKSAIVAAKRESGRVADNGEPKKVVEYLVLQKRMLRGKEENWKVWGFAQESTPESLEEDAVYWRKTLDAQAAQVAG